MKVLLAGELKLPAIEAGDCSADDGVEEAEKELPRDSIGVELEDFAVLYEVLEVLYWL